MLDTRMAPDEMRTLIEEQRIRFVRLWFTDVLGQLKSFAIDAADLPAALRDGIAFDGSSITGFNAIEESDMLARPDGSTFAVLPWRPGDQGVARVVCDVLTPDGLPYEGDPRNVLRRALARMEEAGFDGFEVGTELEYFLFRDSGAAEPLDAGGAFDLTALDAGSDVRRETVLALEQLGIHVASSHHEAGPSQHEIGVRPRDALAAADDCVTARLTVKEIALAHGVHATFMPKPLFGHNGSGMHTHLRLMREGEGVLEDPADPTGLSDAGRAFLAGILRHAREISSVLAQWVNSYKRLVPGYEAPVYIAWSRRNRSAVTRVTPDGVEIRCADPACNPYLAFACLLQAGLDGIERGYELPGPMERNLYHLGPDERRRLGIDELPGTLGEAVELTAASELVLRTLGEHVFNRFVEIKRQEWEDYRVQVTRWELDRHLAVL